MFEKTYILFQFLQILKFFVFSGEEESFLENLLDGFIILITF